MQFSSSISVQHDSYPKSDLTQLEIRGSLSDLWKFWICKWCHNLPAAAVPALLLPARRGSIQVPFTKGLVRHQVPAWHNQAVCTSVAQQGPEPMLFTSYLANGHLRSLRPTNESYPLSRIELVLLQGPPLWIYRQQDHCCFCCSLQWLSLLMFILLFYPLKHIRLTHQHAYTQGVVYLPVRWVRSVYTYKQPHRRNMHPLMENSLMLVFYHAEYILFILVQSFPLYTYNLFHSAPSLSLCRYPLAHKPAPEPGPGCGLLCCG